MFVYNDLKDFERQGRCIRVGLVGAGFMGRGIVEVLESTPGMKVVAIADLDIDRAASCFRAVGLKDFKELRGRGGAPGADLGRERVVTSDAKLIPEMEGLDFIIEATGIPEVGAQVAYLSIMSGKHVGMLNVETDVTIGWYLSRLARRAGVVYTVCTGDEPAAIKELCDFALTLGFKIVACGKGKNNPLDVGATPETLARKAKEMGLNPRILTEFVDGTKTMVEMACVANSVGLDIDRRNMHGPRVEVEKLAGVFRTRGRGGILEREGVVDYAVGGVAPGVFAVVSHERRIVGDTLRYLKIGEGPEFLLYRPYHLTNIEVPISVAHACLYGKPSLATFSAPRTEVITLAKRDLREGEEIDEIGGFTAYGGIESFDAAKRENLLPLGLCKGARLKEDVAKGLAIRLDQVEVKESFLLHLRKVQDDLQGDFEGGFDGKG